MLVKTLFIATVSVVVAQSAPAAAPPAAAMPDGMEPPPVAAAPAPAAAPPPPPPPPAAAAPPVPKAPVSSAEVDAKRREKEQRGNNMSFVRACAKGDLAKFEEMLPLAEKMAFQGDVNFEKSTCAHQAVRNHQGDYLKILKRLVEAGHPLDVVDKSGGGHNAVPLYWAVDNEDQEAFDILFPHTKSFEGTTVRGHPIEEMACMMRVNTHMCGKLKDVNGYHERILNTIKLKAKPGKRERHNPIRRLFGIEEHQEDKDEL